MANQERSSKAAQSDKSVDVVIRDTVPVCLQMCEPVCAESDYQITVTLFGTSLATIAVKGITRLANCVK